MEIKNALVKIVERVREDPMEKTGRKLGRSLRDAFDEAMARGDERKAEEIKATVYDFRYNVFGHPDAPDYVKRTAKGFEMGWNSETLTVIPYGSSKTERIELKENRKSKK